MWASSYFNPWYWASRYWAKAGATIVFDPTPPEVLDLVLAEVQTLDLVYEEEALDIVYSEHSFDIFL